MTTVDRIAADAAPSSRPPTGSDSTEGTTDPDPTGTAGTRRHLVAWIGIGLPFAIAFVVLLARAWSVDWHPVHDFALIQLRTSDVGGAHWPAVGPYSRFGWSHPGPLLFELLAIPYRLLGSRPEGLLVGAVLINAAAVAGSLAVARRRGGMVLVATVAVVLAVLMRALGADVLVSPWNPWVTLLPMVLFFLLAWSVAERDWVAIPWAVLVASFLVQSHVAYAPLTLVAAAVAGLFAWWSRPDHRPAWVRAAGSTDRTRSLRTMVGVGAVAGFVVWLPPLIDLVFGSHNLAKIARYFLDRPPSVGLHAAAGVVATQALPWGPWSTGNEPLDAFVGSVTPAPILALALPVVLLGAGGFVAVRRRDRAGASLALLASAMLVVAVASASRIDAQLFPYLVRFTWGVAAFVWLAVARAWAPAGLELLQRARPDDEARVRTWPVVGVVGVATGILVLALVLSTPGGLFSSRPPDALQEDQMARLDEVVVPAVAARAAAAGGGPVLVRSLDPDIQFPLPSSRGLAAGLVPPLEQAGASVVVAEDDWRLGAGGGGRMFFGDHRLDPGGPLAGTVTVVGDADLDGFVPPPGAEELVRIEDRPAVDAAHREQDALVAELTAAGHADAAAQVRTSQLQWIPFNFPDLAGYGERIQRVVDVLGQPRTAVYWQPGRPA